MKVKTMRWSLRDFKIMVTVTILDTIENQGQMQSMQRPLQSQRY
jgi:hypothetical protein